MSCFGGTDEHLYSVELTVDKLKLTSYTSQDVGDQPLLIVIRFIDFPLIRITQDDFSFAKQQQDALQFNLGQTFLFCAQPKSLVRTLQQSPLKIYVFRRDDTYPTAEAEVFLSGCFCNQIIMAENDEDSLPKPFVVNRTFNLIDPGDNDAGTIFVKFRLTHFGKYLTNMYYVEPAKLFFKNIRTEEKVLCIEKLTNIKLKKTH